jgi:hypothetical protein
MGRNPNTKVIQATHTAELAVGFGRKVKNLIDSEIYRDIFPDLALASDAKASGRWSTSKGGEYYAVGVGGALAGRGADLCIIDDPVSEQDALSPTALDNIYEWYTSGPRQRLQPGGSLIIVMTRWSIRDLTAKVLNKQSDVGADTWEVVEFPAIMLSRGSGGMFGIVVARLPVRTSYNHTIQPSRSQRGQTTLLLLLGAFLSLWMETARPSSYLMRSEVDGIFQSLKKLPKIYIQSLTQTWCLLNKKPVVCRSPKNCGEWGCLSRPLPLQGGRISSHG